MINVKELRVDNLVFRKSIKKDEPLETVKLLGIDGSFDVVDIKNKDCYIYEQIPVEELHGINISESVLLKCGFKKTATLGIETHNYTLNDFRFNTALFWKLQYKNEFTGKNILYLHELQNLYYLLTGDELTVI
jgi:hypothetical protein